MTKTIYTSHYYTTTYSDIYKMSIQKNIPSDSHIQYILLLHWPQIFEIRNTMVYNSTSSDILIMLIVGRAFATHYLVSL